MSKFWIIVGQVYKKNVKSFGFLAMMLSPIILIGIIAAIIFFISQSEQKIPQIAVISDSPTIEQTLQAEEEYFTVDAAIQTKEQAENAMQDEKLDGYLSITDNENSIAADYVHLPDSNMLDMNYLSNLLTSVHLNQQAESLGISPEEVTSLLTAPSISDKSVTFQDDSLVIGSNTDQDLKMFTAYGICIAIFMFIITYAGIIAEEIASEKGTRIMEVLLSSVSSTVHFFGKLVAILLICLTQVAFYVIITIIALQLQLVQELIPVGLDLVATLKGIVGASLYYFVMGIFLYAVIAAFLGSLVTKIEDVSKSVSPIIFIAMIGFYGGIFSMAGTAHPLIKIGSHIPLFTPFMMPFRIAAETVTTTEIWISMVVMLAFTALVTLLSLVLYRSNVLIYGDTGMMKTIRTSFRNVKNERKNTKQA